MTRDPRTATNAARELNASDPLGTLVAYPDFDDRDGGRYYVGELVGILHGPLRMREPRKARVQINSMYRADYEVRELVGDVQQGDMMALVLVEDLVAASWPSPPRQGDIVAIGDKSFNVEAVDDRTRMVGTTLIAYQMRLRG